MDLSSKFDKSMRLRRYGVCFGILFVLFIIWKLSMIETGKYIL